MNVYDPFDTVERNQRLIRFRGTIHEPRRAGLRNERGADLANVSRNSSVSKQNNVILGTFSLVPCHLIQDVASFRGLRDLAQEYLRRFGYNDVILSTHCWPWIGKWPRDQFQSAGLVALNTLIWSTVDMARSADIILILDFFNLILLKHSIEYF